MSRGESKLDRDGLIAALNDEGGRKSSTATILYQLAIADRLGLSLTDLVSGEILTRTGPITAGELAELSGLTTGAITGVVDRLEKVGFVRRVNDPNDRRRVMLEPQRDRFDRMSGDPYAALREQFNAVYAEYDDSELELLLDFLRQSILIFDQETARLRGRAASPAPEVMDDQPEAANFPAEGDGPTRGRAEAHANLHGRLHAGMADPLLLGSPRHGPKNTRVFSAPRGDFELARLKWHSGPVRVEVRGAPEMTELYRAKFQHDIPIVRDNDENVSVQYRHRSLFGRGGGSAEVELNGEVAWEIYFDCGASHLDADLRAIRLRNFWFKSKASKLELQLPRPRGTVQIRLESPLSSLRIERPKQVPVRLEFDGEWAQLRFDRQKKRVGTEIHESPEYKRATDRYVIEFVGGGSKIVVE